MREAVEMSMELHVFARRDQLPNRSDWQSALEDTRFPTVLGPTMDVTTAAGFEPCTFEGRTAGFELTVDPAAEVADGYVALSGRLDDRDVCVSFRWSGDLDEMASAVSASATLAVLADGLFFDPQEDLVVEGVGALRTAAEYLEPL